MTVKEARKSLGKDAKDLTDEQIQELLDQLFCLAEIAVNHFQKMKEVKNYGK